MSGCEQSSIAIAEQLVTNCVVQTPSVPLHDFERSDDLGGIRFVERIGPGVVSMESDMQSMPEAIPIPLG
jgi:hypothetical protein